MCSIFSKVLMACWKSADAVEIHAEAIHGLEIAGFDFEGLAVGVDGFFGSVEFVERDAEVVEPAGVVGIDGDGGAQLFHGFVELVLLEELLCSFDATLGIVPVVHDSPPTEMNHGQRALAAGR